MNKRIFIRKKPGFDVYSRKISRELQNLIPNVKCEVLIIYDLFHISEEDFSKTLYEIFADPVTDIAYTDKNLILSKFKNASAFFAAEPLPGQHDARSHSAEQCLQLAGVHGVKVKTALLYVLENLPDESIEGVKSYLINPIESREKKLDKLAEPEIHEIIPVPVISDFTEMSEEALAELHKEMGFSLGSDDLEFIQKHFQSLKRDPTETELKVLDTYWSDHCRHTTFETELTEIEFQNSFREILQNTYDYYLQLRKEMGITKPVRLMDMATIMGKYLSHTGKITNIDVSEEVNACSIVVPIKVDGKEEEWLLQFKNETHNHPTEVEPYGGAATCVGGAIRDPLSGRAYVYQAMRVSGGGNPLERIEDTLPGKLPQVKISKESANGNSSYGNQIGLTTTHVTEIYDEGYKAKHMEVGYVAGAVKKEYVRREEPLPGDKVILLGGKTGRDGVGGATGSSQTHDEKDIEDLSSEVQRGNPIEERKIQRLFRNPEVLSMIKRSNDFGAGGVSVAIGEIARGVRIDLNAVPLKYPGLNGTEIALSESQERMAVVVEAEDVERFQALAEEENLDAAVVAEVTADERMSMHWKGEDIVSLDRKFLDTNGVRKKAKAVVINGEGKNPFREKPFSKEGFLELLQDLNHTSQKGLVEMFDNSVGRGTVLNTHGGKYQDSPEDISVQKFPTEGFTEAVSMAAWGFDPRISRWSTYHGAYMAVMESVAKIVAGGGDYKDIRLSFQEYFESLREDPTRWGKPLGALLGSIEAQKQLEIPAIGGKDSMSGSWQNIDVPPTLISFAACPSEVGRIKSATLQKTDSKLSVFIPTLNKDYLFDENQLRKIFETVSANNKKILSASIVKFGGIAETLAKMAFGNEIGVHIKTDLELMKFYPAAIVLEHKENPEVPSILEGSFHPLGNTTKEAVLDFNGTQISMKEAKSYWKKTFAQHFPEKIPSRQKTDKEIKTPAVLPQQRILNPPKTAKPRVFIWVLPGTNSEYDSAKAFQKEGAITEMGVFRNRLEKDIDESAAAYAKAIDNSQILFLPGGFSAADEPDGSGKFTATVLRNSQIKDAVYRLLERDGLILGVCNGFQGLIKSGLLPYGKIGALKEDTPTLTFNEIGRHISQFARVKVNKTHSPWLKGMAGKEYWIPFSHGEGRFTADEANLKKLFENAQVATQYVDFDRNTALEMPFNPNGSTMGIEGIVSSCGRIFGRMGHPERYEEGLFKNIPDIETMNIFKNGVEYFY